MGDERNNRARTRSGRAAWVPGFLLLLVGCDPCAGPDPGQLPCGDGTAAEAEICDGADRRGESCATQGFSGGELGCLATCDGFDTSACHLCGNGIMEEPELCDGEDVREATCATAGLVSGTLACSATCDAFEVSACTRCADEVVDVGEECDGTALGANTCESRGYTAGTLACMQDCRFDVTACTGSRHLDCCVENGDVPGCLDAGIAQCVCQVDATCCTGGWDALCAGMVDGLGCGSCVPECGNGRADRGEICDADDTRGTSCRDLGYQGGNLRCDASCGELDLSGCNGDPPVCGNGVIEGREICDGAAAMGLSCTDLGFASGTLGCDEGCGAADTSGCVRQPVTSCGDGFVNGVGELCDQGRYAVGGPSCSDFALGTGAVTCSPECVPDLSACSAGSDLCAALTWYNDGACQPCHLLGGVRDDDCDLACALDGSCGEAFIAGVWSCGAAGLRDPECGVCGDGFRTGAELCDDDAPPATCAEAGYTGGDPGACSAACLPDFSACTMVGSCCEATAGVPGCADDGVEQCVCAGDEFCCAEEWDERCVDDVERLSCGACAE